MLEKPLLVADISQHVAHKAALIDPGKALADTVGALIQAERHRDRDRCLQRALIRAFPQIFEQHVAAQRVTGGRQRASGVAQQHMVDHLGQIIAGTRVISTGAVVGLARATAPVDCHAAPAKCGQLPLLAEDIQ